jgi:hypothetical protein
MTFSKGRTLSIAAALLLSVSGVTVMQNAGAITPALPSATSYTPISVEDVRAEANFRLKNARAAGRLTPEQADKFQANLNGATSLTEVEQTWAQLEATAQQARDKHVSIDNLTQRMSAYISSLVKQGVLSPDGAKTYRSRLDGTMRLKKQFAAKDNFYDFWEFVVLAIDVSSAKERLMRALMTYEPPLESFDELVLRSDNYLANNEVQARQVSVYKSFEVEPDNVRDIRDSIFNVLKDRSHSRTVQTAEVKSQLKSRLFKGQYAAGNTLPSEQDLDKAIAEVQRLLDSGARNGNLKAIDDVRLQHELELVKQLKQAYPGPNPGIDPIERELRAEEVRYMALDLRFLQDWLGRVLRKDGEVAEGRERVLRALRRIDLANQTGRITREDTRSLMEDINTALGNSKTDDELIARVRNIDGRMDMMIADFSMVPAKTDLKLQAVNSTLNNLRLDRSSAESDKNRIEQLALTAKSQNAADKYGVNMVASSELDILRQRVNALLKTQGTMRADAGAPKPGM